jgi:hypothetical protein
MANKAARTKGFGEAFDDFFKDRALEGLKQLLRKHTGENGRRNRLDFKEQMPDYPALAKTILAMGNSGGGIIVLGVAQRKDNSFYAKGLSKFEDKVVFKNGIHKFVPDKLITLVDVVNFSESAKKLQVIFVEDDAKSIPFVSKADGKKIRKAAIYVRSLSSSEEANYVEIQEILHRRCERHELEVYQERLRRELYGELRIKFQRVLGLYITYKEACDEPNRVYLASPDKLEIPGTITFPDEATTQAQYYQLTSEEFTPLAIAYLQLRWAVNVTNQFGQKSLTIGAKSALKELERHIQTSGCVINQAFEKNKRFLKETDNGALLEAWRELRRELTELHGFQHLQMNEHFKDCVEAEEELAD